MVPKEHKIARTTRRTQAVRTNSARYHTPRSCSRLSYTRGMVSSIPTALLAPPPWSSEGGATEKITIPPRVASETQIDQANHGRLSTRPNPGLSTPSATANNAHLCLRVAATPSAYHLLAIMCSALGALSLLFATPVTPQKSPSTRIMTEMRPLTVLTKKRAYDSTPWHQPQSTFSSSANSKLGVVLRLRRPG